MIKVLQIIIGLNVGGAELMLKRLIESYQENPNYHHSVVSLSTIGNVGEQLQEMGIDVRALGIRSPLDIPFALWQLVQMIHAERPDIIQTWMYHADLLGGLAARLAGNRHVIWGIRTTDVNIRGKSLTLLIRLACAWLSHWVPHTIVCAADTSRRAHIAVGYNSSRMVVVPNGFEVARLVATSKQRYVLRKKCEFGADAIVIGSLGRFHAVKDHFNFVKAAELLAQQYSEVYFLLVGRNLDLRNAELVSWIAATGYADRFVLMGQRADVPVCLSAMDMLCLHSSTEGFPNVIGEAMAMGLPCVSTDVGDAAFLIGNTGVIVPKNDFAALALGLKELIDMTREDRVVLGQKAKARIYSEFTMDHCRDRFERIYQRVMDVEGR